MTREKNTPSRAEEELRAVLAEYEAALPRALEARDEGIRRIASEYNLKQVDVIRITGYSRETVRQALNPEVRAAVKKAAEDRKSAKDGTHAGQVKA